LSSSVSLLKGIITKQIRFDFFGYALDENTSGLHTILSAISPPPPWNSLPTYFITLLGKKQDFSIKKSAQEPSRAVFLFMNLTPRTLSSP
jgi:hypothetical protein